MKTAALTFILTAICSITFGQQSTTAPNPTTPPVGGSAASAGTAAGGSTAGSSTTATTTEQAPLTPGQTVVLTNAAPPTAGTVGAHGLGTNVVFPATNISMTSTQIFDFSITNTLTRMSPVQVQRVVQVRGSIHTLQTIAVNVGSVPVDVALRQNVQLQQQVQQVSNHILALAQGSARPQNEVVIRLSEDLVRVLAPRRGAFAPVGAVLTPERELVLAVALNQVMNAQNLSAAQIESAINTGVGALETSGVPPSASHLVACDLKAIALELQPALVR